MSTQSSTTTAQKPFEWLGLSDLTDANKLAAKRQSVESLRTLMKREWALNRVFY